MIKKVSILILALFFLVALVYYYFFGFYFKVINNSTKFDITNISCETHLGDKWHLGALEKGEILRELISLSSGSSFTCYFDFDGTEKKSKLVVGYFNEDTSSVGVIIEDNDDGDITIKLKEI